MMAKRAAAEKTPTLNLNNETILMQRNVKLFSKTLTHQAAAE